MTKNEIITSIYKSHMIDKFASTFISYLKGDVEEFKCHIYMVLCEMEEDKLKKLYENNEIGYYLYYISKAQAVNSKSDFHREMDGIIDIDKNIDIYEDDNNFNED